MTHSDINLFLTSIAEAKRALDAEPGYQAEITRLHKNGDDLAETLAKRELHIHELKKSETELHAKLRSVEAERDDAGFRCLEETDRVQALLTLVRQNVNDSLKLIATVEGNGPLAVVSEAEIKTLRNDLFAAQNDNKLFGDQVSDLHGKLALAQEQLMPKAVPVSEPVHQETTGYWGGEHPAPFTQGQGEADPTAHGTTSKDTASYRSGDAPFAPVVSQEPVASTDHEVLPEPATRERNRDKSTQYTNRKYYDIPVYVSTDDWLNGGGTEADYHWRPAGH